MKYKYLFLTILFFAGMYIAVFVFPMSIYAAISFIAITVLCIITLVVDIFKRE